MQLTDPLATLMLLATAAPTALAADCGNSGACINYGATRDEMYAARQEVCGTNRWIFAGTYNIPGRSGYLRWGQGYEGYPQQVCWDAFQNIIDQCSLGANGLHTHAGQYEYNGHYFNAVDCA